ncbi:MAG: type II secretion system F family protein [Candidatus Margulisiibacteriota bacterium]|jgi:type IV pilus assembly protein PilC
MPELSYTARTKNGELKKGIIEKNSKEELVAYLNQRDLILTEYKEIKTGTSIKVWFDKLNNKFIDLSGVPVSEKIFFTQNLMVMIKAGISLSQALTTLAEQTTNKRMRKILADVQNQVEKGKTLGDSLQPYVKIFGELYINMMKAGEAAGQMEQVLKQLTLQMKKDHHLVSKVKGALVYPVIVVTAMIIIIVIMFVFVIPQITAIFKEVDAELPLPTKILIALSDFVVNNGLLVFISSIIIIGSFIQFIRNKKGKIIWHRFILKLPIISPILKKVSLARFSRTTSSLLKTDIPITENFLITAKVLGNTAYRLVLNSAAEELKKGVNIHTTLESRTDLFPPIVIQMIAVGEETGSLDTILEQLAIFYEEEVDQTMNNLTATLEPILMLLLGLGVGSIAVAVIMPMYSLTQAF